MYVLVIMPILSDYNVYYILYTIIGFRIGSLTTATPPTESIVVMSKTIYNVKVPDSVASHTVDNKARETSLLDNESEEDKRQVTLLLSFQWRSVETRETASGQGDGGEGQTGTGTGSASNKLYALEASLDGSPFKGLLHAHIPSVLHSKERQGMIGTGPHHPHHTRSVTGSSLDVFAPIEWVYDDDTEVVTMPTSNYDNNDSIKDSSTGVKSSAYKTINSLSTTTSATKQHSDQWGFHCTESECPAPWLVSEVLILEAGEGRGGHLMDSDIAGAFRHFQHRHQTLLSASPSASYSVLTSGSNSSVTLTRDPHTPKPRSAVTDSTAVPIGAVDLTTMKLLTPVIPPISIPSTSIKTSTTEVAPPPTGTDPSSGLPTSDKITSLISTTSDRHAQQLIPERTGPLPIPFPLAPYVDTRTYTRSPALKPAPLGEHFTGATDTVASIAHQACLPFTTGQLDAYIPPSSANKESVEKWRTAVTALTNRIRAKKLGGSQLLDYLRTEAAVLQRLRDELFCP